MSDRDPTAIRLRYARQRLHEVLAVHKSNILLIETAWPSKNPSLSSVHRVGTLCKLMCRARRVLVASVPATTVRRTLLGYGEAGKAELAAFVASVYPELRVYLHQREVWNARHFHNFFDAVARGL